jgi:uncharacterized protein (DUF2132 family)
MTGVSVSAWGRRADSSAAGVEPSSATAALGSSPSQDKSVDFLLSTQWVVNQVRLQIYMYYSGRSSLTSSTGLLSRLGRQVCWRCRLVQLQQAPPLRLQ